jgi:FkbH-like protein
MFVKAQDYDGSMLRAAIDDALARLSVQSVLLVPHPQRLALLQAEWSWPTEPIDVHFHRTVPAEHAAMLLAPFAAYAGFGVTSTFGPYDDALSFATEPPAGAVEVFWLDYGRYAGMTAADVAGFVAARVAVRRAATERPILVLEAPDAELAECLREALDPLPDTHLCPVTADAAGARTAALSGSTLSGAAFVAVAQALGLQWLPAALGVRLRGVVVDLDNTLYDGVVSEDGVAGIRIDDDHRALHAALRDLRARGFFLGLLSRNEPEDVDALLDGSAGLGLSRDDVDALSVSTGAKSEGLAEIAAQLRVAPQHLLVVDDNAGELAQLLSRFPALHTLHASTPRATADALALAPGLFRFRESEADLLRLDDLRANEARSALAAEAGSAESYLASLQVELAYSLDDPAQLPRLAELSAKTNQFCTALARLDERELRARMGAPGSHVVGVRLRDRLSDSGLIGVLVATETTDGLLLEDVCISCRALGRGLEGLLIDEALRELCECAGATSALVAFRPGPRNAPAREWLERAGRGDVVEPVGLAAGAPVTIEWFR